MKRIRLFTLNIHSLSLFTRIREYLMTKYTVYTAIFSHGYALFRIAY
jgi:hypothetical protein